MKKVHSKLFDSNQNKLGRRVYLDYAATTPLHPQVLKAMLPYFEERFGNPSSIHSWGQEARAAIDRARQQIARILDCEPFEIYFTGTTTISDNLAILGTLRAAQKTGRGNHLITSSVEHHAVLDTCQALEKEGLKLTVLPVDRYGMVDPEEVKRVINEKTVLVTVMTANNEVGTIQPIREIATQLSNYRILKKRRIYFHTDAATAVEYLDLGVKGLGVDLMSLGAHKFGGPKGVGILYLKKGVEIEPITCGGHHERGFWPGTEAVPLIIGLAKAIEVAARERKAAAKKVGALRERLIKGILARIPDCQLTGHPSRRLPDIASFVIKGVEGEAVLLHLSDKGVAASSGSACTSGVLKPSHVLIAMGVTPEMAHGSLRFSLGKKTTREEIDYVLEVLPKIVGRLRKMAPELEK